MDFLGIQLEEPQFTHGEAVAITGVPSKTLNNWTQRGIVHVGTLHRTGRRLYSLLDLIELTIIGELADMVAMPVANAAAIAKEVREHVLTKEQSLDLSVWFEAGAPKINRPTFSRTHTQILIPVKDIRSQVAKKALDVLKLDAP